VGSTRFHSARRTGRHVGRQATGGSSAGVFSHLGWAAAATLVGATGFALSPCSFLPLPPPPAGNLCLHLRSHTTIETSIQPCSKLTEIAWVSLVVPPILIINWCLRLAWRPTMRPHLGDLLAQCRPLRPPCWFCCGVLVCAQRRDCVCLMKSLPQHPLHARARCRGRQEFLRGWWGG
jgi:hypothetical protein